MQGPPRSRGHRPVRTEHSDSLGSRKSAAPARPPHREPGSSRLQVQLVPASGLPPQDAVWRRPDRAPPAGFLEQLSRTHHLLSRLKPVARTEAPTLPARLCRHHRDAGRGPERLHPAAPAERTPGYRSHAEPAGRTLECGWIPGVPLRPAPQKDFWEGGVRTTKCLASFFPPNRRIRSRFSGRRLQTYRRPSHKAPPGDGEGGRRINSRTSDARPCAQTPELGALCRRGFRGCTDTPTSFQGFLRVGVGGFHETRARDLVHLTLLRDVSPPPWGFLDNYSWPLCG